MPKVVVLPLFALTIVMTTLLGVVSARAQTEVAEPPRIVRAAPAEFEFVRLAYAANRYGRGGWRRQMWRTDYPDAELHFLKGVSRLTRVSAAENGRILTPLDEDIFDYPWIYAVEVGYWHLNAQESERIREYLLRGGFLMVDDFHGALEWASFVASMQRVFPDRPIVEIPEDDEAFHVIYDLDQKIQIPSLQIIYSGVSWEKGGVVPHWRGIYDDDGRLMVAINFNMDLGDAWEHADWPEYPENMTALAYRFGINYLIYAMTH
jgi:hypothetical protein